MVLNFCAIVEFLDLHIIPICYNIFNTLFLNKLFTSSKSFFLIFIYVVFDS